VPLAVKDKWQRELERYLRQRQALVGLILLSDIRHPLKEFDRMMIDWSVQSNLPMHILLTKADKLKRGASQNVLLKVQNQLKDFDEISVQLFSAMKRTGIEVARDKLTSWLSPPETAPDGSATATQGLDT